MRPNKTSRWTLLLAAMLAPLPALAAVSTDLLFISDSVDVPPFHKESDRIVSDSRTYADDSVRGAASASVDLGTGELKARASGEKLRFSEFAIGVEGRADAVDTLTIDGPGTTPIDVTFQLIVEGDLIVPASATGGGSSAFATVEVRLGVDGKSENAFLQRRRSYDAVGTLVSDSLQGLGDFQGEQPVAGTTDHYDLLLELVAPITPGTPFAFDTYLRALVGSFGPVGGDSIADFSHTAHINIIVPETYSLASESGVFLAGPVPEPQTWAMLGGGLLMVAGLARRRTRSGN